MENSNLRETKRINIGRHFTDLPYSLAIHIHETSFTPVLYDFRFLTLEELQRLTVEKVL